MSSLKSIRRTNRGIKICPNCKFPNANRFRFCKNINCGEILPKGHCVLQKRSSSNNLIDSSKLVTDNTTAIFSVKIRKCGPDYRGFVVFKNLEDDLILPDSVTYSSSGLCYVKNCKIKNYDSAVETGNEVAANCQHIEASVNCENIANPLYLDHSIVQKLKVKNTMKQEILKLSNSMCPLVQRISKHVMVVKTKKTKKHPLGYLHVLFQTDKNRYNCNCDISRPEMLEINEEENDLTFTNKMHNGRRECIHFYSCACAFASNSELKVEFQCFVDSIFPSNNNTKIFETDSNNCVESNYISSIIESDDNIIHLTDDIPVYMELDDSSTYLSKTVKLEDGNTLMMEVHDDSSDCKSTADKSSTFQLNDVIFLEADKDNQISDVFLTDNSDPLNDIKSEKKPLDIQIMLADSSDVMKFPNLILQEIPISVDSSVLIKKYNDVKLSDDFNTIDGVPFKHGTYYIDKDKDDDCNRSIVQNLYTLPNLDDELLFLNLTDDNKLIKSKDCIITSISNDDDGLLHENPDKSILKKCNSIKNAKKLKSILKIHNEKPNDEPALFLNNNVSNIITIDATIPNSSESNRAAILNNIIDSNKMLFGHKDTEYTLPSVICNTRENQTNLPFLQWLTGVTEQLNQTMHFQFNGKPKPLTYQIPLSFFECLRDRMCPDIRKKRLPNLISEFHRTNSLPLGKFTKYSWNILKINQVKRIFDTPDMPLEVIRFFCQNPDGTYDHIENPRVNKAKLTAEVKSDKKHVNIQPGVLVTYLKVGKTSTDDKIAMPFCIEWIPNILPKSKVGELTLKFEYGHKSNYHI
ncbi:uncharacterized protein C2orf42 homolog [Arctopsyche grandis]|uniref:uncharacterized protein C2orf42 homolog n=1 Tax=Arctopsyche grandis TaxID=121162 RepID=UPI00406D80A6